MARNSCRLKSNDPAAHKGHRPTNCPLAPYDLGLDDQTLAGFLLSAANVPKC